MGTDYLSSHLIIDEATGECAFKDLKFRFIELKKFHKKAHELKNIIDKWTFFIKNADKLEVMPGNIDDEGLKEAYEEAAQHNWTREAYDAYIYSGMREQDERGRLSKAKEKAEKEGEERGEKKGKMNVARKMKDKGMSTKDISDLTGLTEEEIELL
jgi:predicted transposase/invertase (TIGR01784 family)